MEVILVNRAATISMMSLIAMPLISYLIGASPAALGPDPPSMLAPARVCMWARSRTWTTVCSGFDAAAEDRYGAEVEGTWKPSSGGDGCCRRAEALMAAVSGRKAEW